MKKRQIILLPTNERANIGDFIISKYDHNNKFVCGVKKGDSYNMSETRHNLYVIAEDIIQKGDLVYSQKTGVEIFDGKDSLGYMKVIGSTNDRDISPDICFEFVKDFLSLYNKNKNKTVFVEYNKPVCQCDTLNKLLQCPHADGDNCYAPNPNNDFYGLFPKVEDGNLKIKLLENTINTTKLSDGFETFECNEPLYRKFGGQYGHIIVMNDVPYFIPKNSDGMDVEDISDVYHVVSN